MEASDSYAPLAFLAAAPSNYTVANRPYSNSIGNYTLTGEVSSSTILVWHR